jgi:hypothetical protein
MGWKSRLKIVLVSIYIKMSTLRIPFIGSFPILPSAHQVLLGPRNFSRGRGVVPSLAERGGAVLAAYVSVLKCGQVYSTLYCLLVGTSHSDCITYCTVTVILIISCIVHIAIVIWSHALVFVGNVFFSGSSSERHHSKSTASRALQQRLSFRAAKVTRH